MEALLYVLPQKKSRTIVPKTVTLLILSVIFYIGILVNIALLELTGKDETLLKTGALILVAVVVLLGCLIAYHHARSTYRFYAGRICFEKKEILYKDIIDRRLSRNFLDKLFKTYSVSLGQAFFIKHVPEEVDIISYIQQLVEYAKKVKQS